MLHSTCCDLRPFTGIVDLNDVTFGLAWYFHELCRSFVLVNICGRYVLRG